MSYILLFDGSSGISFLHFRLNISTERIENIDMVSGFIVALRSFVRSELKSNEISLVKMDNYTILVKPLFKKFNIHAAFFIQKKYSIFFMELIPEIIKKLRQNKRFFKSCRKNDLRSFDEIADVVQMLIRKHYKKHLATIFKK